MICLLHQDPDKKFLEKTRHYLDKKGNFSICPVSSLQEAHTILATRKFDVIVSGQPEGIDLLKALKSGNISTPFIFFSVPAGENMVIEALNLGADYYLVKGDEPETEFERFQQIIEEIVTRSEINRDHVKITDQDPAPMMRVSKDGILIYANPAGHILLKRWGVTVGQPMFDLVNGTVNKAFFGGTLPRTDIEAGEDSYVFTFRPLEKENFVTGHHSNEKKKRAELEDTNAALKAEIAQRKLAEANARRTLSLLNAAFESTADGILVVDRVGRITNYNRKYVNMWNIPDSVIESKKHDTITEYIKKELKDPEGYHARQRELSDHPDRESSDMLELNDGRVFERYSIPQKIGNAVVGRVWNFREVTDRKKAEESLQASLRDKEVMLREIHHRVKNNLQIVSGLLDMTRKRAQDPATSAILMDMMMKIDTMAQIHTRLYESKQFNNIDMKTQIRDQISALANIYSKGDCEISTLFNASSIYLSVDKAIPCALVVNEILTNAYKHAFRGRERGSIEISAVQDDGHMCISIRDDGVGISSDLDTVHGNSLGFKLFRALVQYQLKGSFTINNDNGTEVFVKFPVDHVGI